MNGRRISGRRRGKRMLDFTVAGIAIVLLTPLLASIALLLVLLQGSPVLFRQDRPGFRGEVFRMYKFRTMTDRRDVSGRLLPDEQRISKFGRLLRCSSLDELPELINVLRGEMSLVGPRPLLVQYLPLYDDEQRRRHDVLPGITGWAQVCGRNAVGWAEKFALDVWYVDNRSLWLDLRILALTIARVARRSGVNQPGRATVDVFVGAAESQVPHRLP